MRKFIAVYCLVVGWWLNAVPVPLVAAEKVAVTIDAAQRRPEINPFIYGQFIEHLGRCIYGGIWAEMLEDRKFYFPIVADYDPYKSLQDTDFPVVGASPWQIIGDPGGVTMDSSNPFVGDHTPRIDGGHGIRQRDLAVRAGKKYQGYIWLKAADGAAGTVEINLVSGADAEPVAFFALGSVGGDYQKHEFELTAPENDDHAMLEVRVSGDKPVLVGTLSLMPADNIRGMRADTLTLLKQLDAPLYRWPGGNFVSGYDWRDGIGDRDRRPPRKNPAWTGVEHNDVGLDEFIDFCREVGAEPMIAANTGFGDDYSAAQEVEYVNGAADTIGGGWRVKNGHAKPYNVKHWCVGNEMFGDWQLGYMRLDQYALKHNLVARAMLKADPSLKLVGVGDLGGPDARVRWSEGMLRQCANHMDYISEHFYRGRTPWGNENPASVADHVAMLKDSIREKVDGHRKLQKELGLLPDKMVPIAMDEWNYWHRDYDFGELGCHYDLADALGVAAGLHEYFRQTDFIHMANYAQTVNVIGCIKTTKTDAFLDTTALPLMLYRRHFGSTPLGVQGDHEKLHVDVAAALSKDEKTLTVGVVNANKDPVIVQLTTKDLNIATQGRQWVVAGDDPKAVNNVERPKVAPRESEANVDGDWEIPGYAFAILALPIE